MGIIIGFFTVGLLLLCAFVVLVILMQKPSANAGMGAALGGGAAESAFGAQTGNVLTRATILCTVGFFVLSFGLYLAHMARATGAEGDAKSLGEQARQLGEQAALTQEEAEEPISLTDPIMDGTPTQAPETSVEIPESVTDAMATEADATNKSTEESAPDMQKQEEAAAPQPEADTETAPAEKKSSTPAES